MVTVMKRKRKKKTERNIKNLDDYLNLFNKDEWWEKYWQGMPEYIQEDLTSFKSIIVHFRNQKDMDEFAELIDQKIKRTTKYIWYPEVKRGVFIGKMYYISDKEK